MTRQPALRPHERRTWRWASLAVAALLTLLAQTASLSAASAGPAASKAAETVTVLIELDGPPDATSMSTRTGRASSAVAPLAGEVRRTFRGLPYAAVELPASALDALRQAPGVVGVHPVVDVEPLLDGSLAVIQAVNVQRNGVTLTGAGQTVAVLDTGVRSGHPFFARPGGSRVVGQACFSSSMDCPNGEVEQIGPGAGEPLVFRGTPNRHGTHVAGIVGGHRSGSNPARGVAPGSGLVSVQVFGDHGAGGPTARSDDLIAAMEWLYEVHDEHDIAVLNLSLGGGAYAGICDDMPGSKPIIDAVEKLRDVGIVTVAASGNGALRDQMSWPACISNIVSVGATTKADAVAWFTNVNGATDVLAPGASIRSSVVAGYDTYSGTSMAAPHVAGAVALLKEAVPDADWEALRGALRTSRTMIDDGRTSGVHKDLPRLDLPAAVGALSGSSTGAKYLPLTPSRVLDTRNGTGSARKPLGHRESRSVKVVGVGGVPSSGVGAVVLNVTAVDASRGTFVTVWPRGVSRPNASTLNPAAGEVSANEVVAKVGSNGRVNIYNHNGEVDLLFDVVGYLPG